MKRNKKCPKCGTEFFGSPSYCNPCQNVYQKAWSKKNGHSSQDNKKEEKRNFIRSLKNVPCKDCGKSYPYFVMDFDHLHEKSFNLSIAVQTGYSLERIRTEAQKCDVICANCHRIRTFTRK